jgi:SAM-dependent methyltransferase
MTSANHKTKSRGKEFAYLCVDDFMENLFHARALATAFEIGLVDFMLQNGNTTLESIAMRWETGHQAMQLLLSILMANRVVEEKDGRLRLTEDFVHALEFRDLLQLKLQMTNFAAHDFLNYFSDLICRPDQFGQKSNFRRLFDYGRCFEHSKENYERTKQWMWITTTLTKYEAQACLAYHDFSRYRRILDIGGNSGEFVLRICRSHSQVHATVFDLPLVCDIGLERIRSEPEADRIAFIKGNALGDELPGGFDLVTFKSMLHDWPEKDARHLVARAAQALKPGGTLLIFERGPIELAKGMIPYSTIPMLLFFHSFRGPSLYIEQLRALGFDNVEVQRIDLEMPFFLMTASRKPEARS